MPTASFGVWMCVTRTFKKVASSSTGSPEIAMHLDPFGWFQSPVFSLSGTFPELEVTLCGWQDIKVWLWTNQLTEFRSCVKAQVAVLGFLSVDIKQHWTMLRHWSQFVPNMSTDIRGHEGLHHQLTFPESAEEKVTWKEPNKSVSAVSLRQTIVIYPQMSCMADTGFLFCWDI